MTTAEIASSVAHSFASRFGSGPRLFRAPGRVNLIGEHTDYNDGFVLPAAIDLYTWTAINSRADRKLVVHSQNFSESAEIDLNSTSPAAKDHWLDYVHGVAVMLQKAGIPVSGANMAIFSNVPLGSGLSSSAALEVSVASALLAVSGRSLGLAEIAKLCQRAENEFVGARVGIMDQFASCFGSAGKAILLDCRSLDYKLLPLPADVAMVICNTMVKHEHSGGEYNERRAQCEEGVRLLRQFVPAAKALRDITLVQLEAHRADLPAQTYLRCHHVISENERVIKTVRALQSGDMAIVGKCMAESHRSLKEDYEVSSVELDAMVSAAQVLPGVIGARMTGGGFGGCTINLVRMDAVDNFKHAVGAAYRKVTGIEPEIYVSTAGAGVTEITSNE
ncbi:MAG TPA: galactokinase [Candidatus Acidoferrum sp.]|nr:galactokinase [Candidatus Acidoferrum sp.]